MKITVTDSSTSVTVQPRNFTVTLSGARGPAGQGLPDGGAEGQIIVKQSATDYDTAWADNYATNVELYVKNSTAGAMTKGQVVYVSGADGNNPTVSLAIATTEAGSSKTIGVLKQDLAVGALGYVVTDGLLEGLNTNAASVAGDTIWLSPTTAGGVVYGTANKPSAPNHLVFIGYVIRKNINNGKIFVKIQNGFELEELHNVAISNPVTGQVLKYNATTQLWSNDTDAGGINTLNALTASSQSFATGTSGTDFAISSSTSTHTFNIPTASASARGLLSSTDWSTFNGKQGALSFDSTPTNGSTNPVTSDGVFDALALKQNALTNPVTGTGTSGQVSYWTGTGTQGGSANLFWDAVNSRLGVGTNTPSKSLDIVGNMLINSTSITQPFALFETSTVYKRFTIDYLATFQTQINFGFLGRFQYDGNGAVMNIENTSTSANAFLRFIMGTTERIRLFSNGNLSIQNGGTFTDNGQRLQVYGSTLLRGSGTTSSTTALLVQNSTPTELFKVLDNGSTTLGLAQTFTTGNLQYSHLNINGDFTVNTSANNSVIGSINSQLITEGTASIGSGRLINAIFNNRNTSTGNTIRAGYFSSRTSSSGGGNTFIGSTSDVTLDGSGNITNVSAIEAGITKSNTSIITNAYGVRINNLTNTGGTITNTYGIYIGDITAGTQTNTPYAIYSEDASAVSYIAGNTAIGTTTTSGGRLTVRGSGTTSATTALLVQNSTPTNLLQVLDNGRVNQTLEGSSSSTAFGTGALSVATGASNTAFGNSAGNSNTTANNNSYFGVNAGALNLTGNFNSFFGKSSGQNTTSGSNSFFGYNCGINNTSGSENVFFGERAGNANTTGSRNTNLGSATGFYNTTGSRNIFLGYQTGNLITGGSTTLTIANNSIFIGYDTRAAADNETNQIVIGYQTTGLGSNTTTIGNTSTTNNYIYGNFNITDKNIILGTTTGTKIGTATSQKLAFWNATPVAQPTTAIAEATFTENSGGTAVNVDSTFAGYTLQQIAQALKDIGILQ